MAIAWERFAAADTLIHVDLPLFVHSRWITKRLIKGLFADPPGWPENSPLWSSSVQSYRVLTSHPVLAARDGGSHIEEGAPLEITWPNLLFP
jgi:hypothetical protein